MKRELKDIPFIDIYRGRNVRLPGLAKEEELYQDIKANGLNTPMSVVGVNEMVEVVQGHLRHVALERLQKEEPARFKEMFPGSKVECLVLSDITYEQAQILKLDHGNENPLTNPMEVQLSMNFLFDAGKKEAEIATQLAGLLNRVSPMKVTKKKELDALRDDIALYQETGKFDNIPEKERQIKQLLLDYYKGKIQNAKAIWRCPHVVMASMWYKATGVRNWEDQLDVDIGDDVYLPTLLQVATIRNKLEPAFAKDLQIKNSQGVCEYNKRLPGPNFNSVWEDIVEKSQKKETDPKIVREKAFSKDNLTEDEKKYLSAGFRMLCAAHRRDPEVDPNRLMELDRIAYFAELVSERSGPEWDEFVALAKNLEALKASEQKEVEAAAKDTTITAPPKKAAKAADTKEKPAKIIRKAGKSKDKRASAK